MPDPSKPALLRPRNPVDLAIFLILIAGVIMLFGNRSQSVDTYQGKTPDLQIESYFNGPVKAWGMIQDRKGEVIRRFDIDMIGQWDGNKGTLDEEFQYYDGETQTRTWHITKNADGTYTGTAEDIVGEATGQTAGFATNWAYRMDLDVDGKIYRIKFDDWMFKMNDGVLINKSYLKKFGFTVATLTIFMRKQGS